MAVAIFDLDGCVSDDTRRAPRLPDWAAYHAGQEDDEPKNLDVIQKHINSGDSIVFLTARPEIYRKQSERWIMNLPLDLGGKAMLFMRPRDSLDSSPVFKASFVKEHWKPSEVSMCYDDREDVVWAYRAAGYRAERLCINQQIADRGPVVETFLRMSQTYQQRNGEYKASYNMVGELIKVLHPNGELGTKLNDKPHIAHLYTQVLSKLARFAASDLTHTDSIEDLAVYCAILSAEVRKS